MIKQIRFIFSILLTLLLTPVSFSEVVILKPKAFLDVISGELVVADLLIEDGKIKDIGKFNIENANEILLPDLILLPGLMDSHVHLIGNTESKGYESISESSYLDTIYGVENASKTLMAGFTTVRNVGAGYYADVALKRAIDAGVVPGPSMLVSGPALGITGGHCDTNLFPPEFDIQGQGVVDSPWEARKMVRTNRKYGADLIKFCATGGVMSRNTDVNAKQFTLDEMKAIVDEAHNHGMKVAAHAHGLEGIKAAIIAGADSIEHSSFIDTETTLLAIEKGTFLSMDIFVSDYILGEGAEKGILEESLEKERTVGRKQRENFANAHSLGAKISFGTDAGIFAHGQNARQFAYMVEWGMTNLEAIQAATIQTADLFGINNVGIIEPGFDADIIGVRSNPLANIRTLENIAFVMKEGRVYKNN